MKPPTVVNETRLDGRAVATAVRFAFRWLDVDGSKVLVKVKHHRGDYAYSGRIYYQAWAHSSHVWSNARGDWREVAPVVPRGIDHLIVCRVGAESIYPCETHVYDRRDSPGIWRVETWQEALVSIAAHEATHLRQYRRGGTRNEVETEWAAFRVHRAYHRRTK